jgi:hypothetical protein
MLTGAAPYVPTWTPPPPQPRQHSTWTGGGITPLWHSPSALWAWHRRSALSGLLTQVPLTTLILMWISSLCPTPHHSCPSSIMVGDGSCLPVTSVGSTHHGPFINLQMTILVMLSLTLPYSSLFLSSWSCTSYQIVVHLEWMRLLCGGWSWSWVWRPMFLLRIIDSNDLANPVKRVDLGQIWVNLGHHLETLTDNP